MGRQPAAHLSGGGVISGATLLLPLPSLPLGPLQPLLPLAAVSLLAGPRLVQSRPSFFLLLPQALLRLLGLCPRRRQLSLQLGGPLLQGLALARRGLQLGSGLVRLQIEWATRRARGLGQASLAAQLQTKPLWKSL